MNKFSILLFCLFAAAFSSCKDDKTETPDLRLFAPEVTDVTGTAASVSCSAAFRLSEHVTGAKGFAYGPASDASDTYRLMENPTLDGNTLACRLSGLAPETAYRVFAYVEAGALRVVSPVAEFTTLAVAADEPVLEITSLTTLTVPAAGGDCTITYTVLNPAGDILPEAACEAEWIRFLDAVPGEIAFTADENTGVARETTITIAYPGAESRTVTVRQDAAEERPDPAKTVVLTPETAGWPGSYQSVTTRVGEYRYRIGDVAVFSDKIQFKSGSGVFSNAEEIGAISRIELVYTSTNDKNIRLYTGDAPEPTANEVRPEQSGDRFVFDCTASPHRYFTLQNGSGVSYLSSITIVCGSDSPDPEPGKPAFGKPSFSDVTKGSATIRCPFAYEGDKTVSQLYFTYRTGSGAEQRCDAITDDSGVAVGYLTNLSPLTIYTFRLRAEIGGETFSGEEASFTTNGESVHPGGDMPYPGWAELPLEVEKTGDYHYLHKFSDGARNYTVCYSEDYHCAVWTAHPMHEWYMNGSAGRASFGYDPEIDQSLQPTLSGTYSPSTYHRGHMVASSDRQRTKTMNKQVFYYTNMAPQIQNEFNGGIWNKLERKIQNSYTCSDTLYVVTGSYFGDPSKTCKDTPGKKTVVVPTHFYKVLLRTKSGRTGKSVRDLSANDLQCCVFWLEHSYTYGTKGDISRELMMTVEEAERRTGFTFFPNVPNAPKGTMNPSEWDM